MKPLATVGDAILGAAVVSWLYENGTRDSGTLTKDRSRKVKREKTRDAAKKLGLECYILWGNGEKIDEVWNNGTRAFDTAFEALIGAVFFDAKKRGSDGLAAVNHVLKKIQFFE